MAKICYLTDTGKVRDHNEDAFLVRPDDNVFVVADGVGGNNSGEVASQNAVLGIDRFLKRRPIERVHNAKNMQEELMEYFLECLREINRSILADSITQAENAGMATTVVMAHLINKTLYVVNLGDSRAYLIRKDEINQITEDHTYVNKLVKTGNITKQEAEHHPKKNVITKALGADHDVQPDFFKTTLKKKDRVILCSDGLHGELSDEEILRIVKAEKDPDGICQSLVASANEKGGRDNITVICIEI